jgi:hypothetical protein
MPQPNPLYSHPTKPSHHRSASQSCIVIPALKHTATRLQCLANYKLRIESSRNEPRLGRLLGHISIYDNMREYRREELMKTSCPYPISDAPLISPPSPTPKQPQRKYSTIEKVSASATALEEYVSRVPSFQDFQAAIELQLATLAHIQQSSKSATRTYSDSCPTINEESECVQEYCDSESDISDYDSYDGDDGWRDHESDDTLSDDESMTDPESVRSSCSSPVEEEDEDDFFSLKPLVPLVAACA